MKDPLDEDTYSTVSFIEGSRTRKTEPNSELRCLGRWAGRCWGDTASVPGGGVGQWVQSPKLTRGTLAFVHSILYKFLPQTDRPTQTNSES